MSCYHEVAEGTDIKLDKNGYLVSTCTVCDREIFADRIDHGYYEESAEIVVLNWEAM